MRQPRLHQQLPQPLLICPRKPILRQWQRRRAQDECQIHRRVTGHRESQLRAIGVVFLDRHHQQRGGVENRGQHRQPRLIVVLRAIVTEDWERKMALKKLRRPVFPFAQEGFDLFDAARARGAQQELASAGG